jgi:DNA-binding transcriptional ArsR family regulator
MVKKVSIWLTLEPLLYSEPKHLAEIARELKKSHTTVRKQLAIFERIGLISKERKGRQTFYKLKHVPLFIDYLTIIEKERLIKRCQEELLLKEIVKFLHKFKNSFLIFGSAVNSLKKARDIDLLVIGKFNKKEIKVLEEKLNLKFHLINIASLKDINKSLKQEIKKKHLIIQGCEEIIKWLIS